MLSRPDVTSRARRPRASRPAREPVCARSVGRVDLVGDELAAGLVVVDVDQIADGDAVEYARPRARP